MKTDIPLKRLTQLCPTDLLPLFGAAGATVLRVESLELPTGKSSLDCVLHLLAPDGSPYLHIIEWQGWHDAVVLWRAMSYLGWLGQNRPERPILITIIYLKPGDDVGDTLVQQLPGQPGWMLRLPCVRLWEQDAQQAVASGLPGLLALSPLMAGATAVLVEEAAQQLLQTTQPPLQADLLTALGVFAEPLLSAERFLHMITKERLMSSDLFQLVYQDKLAEIDQERVDMNQERQLWRQQMVERSQERDIWRQTTQNLVEDALMLRFPTAPLQLLLRMRQIRDTPTLQSLHHTILATNDLLTVEKAIVLATANVEQP